MESGPLDMKAMCGEELMLVHSSGVPVPIDEYGVSVPGLEHGESYFLVSKQFVNLCQAYITLVFMLIIRMLITYII